MRNCYYKNNKTDDVSIINSVSDVNSFMVRLLLIHSKNIPQKKSTEKY